MDLAIIGVAGTCGRQLLFQLLAMRILDPGSRLQLVGHAGGTSEHVLWGLRADALDAFDDWAPQMDIVLDPGEVDADLVLMMAGATISNSPHAPVDRAALGRTNAAIFTQYADALADRPGGPPTVIVQSNPVELAVSIFAERLGDTKVLGAAGLSDSWRFARELGAELGLHRRSVTALMLGQHGDHLVPIWSRLQVPPGVRAQCREVVKRARAGRELESMPEEIRAARARVLDQVRNDQVEEAFGTVGELPPDLRAAVKPFFTHFTAGRTTEAVTARAVAALVAAMVSNTALIVPAQVRVANRLPGIDGVACVPVALTAHGWDSVIAAQLADDEAAALHLAADAIAAANAEFV